MPAKLLPDRNSGLALRALELEPRAAFLTETKPFPVLRFAAWAFHVD